MFGKLGWGGDASNNRGFGGYLYKLKRKHNVLLPQWNKRWFSVEGKLLKWYQFKESSEPSGSVDLSQVTEIAEFEAGNDNSFGFIIRCSTRNILLRATSVSDLEKWLRLLRQQTSRAHGGNGTSLDFKSPSKPPMPSAATGRKPQGNSSSLEMELNKTLEQLNKLEADHAAGDRDRREGAERGAQAKESEFTHITVNDRCMGKPSEGSLQQPHHATSSQATAAAQTMSGPTEMVMSSDNEISLGKKYCKVGSRPSSTEPGGVAGSGSNVRRMQFTDDGEIVIGVAKKPPAGTPPVVKRSGSNSSSHTPRRNDGSNHEWDHDDEHNSSAIIYYGTNGDEVDDDEGEVDEVQVFAAELGDEDDRRYDAKLAQNLTTIISGKGSRTGSSSRNDTNSASRSGDFAATSEKDDYVSQPMATSDAKKAPVKVLSGSGNGVRERTGSSGSSLSPSPSIVCERGSMGSRESKDGGGSVGDNAGSTATRPRSIGGKYSTNSSTNAVSSASQQADSKMIAAMGAAVEKSTRDLTGWRSTEENRGGGSSSGRDMGAKSGSDRTRERSMGGKFSHSFYSEGDAHAADRHHPFDD